MQGFREVDLKDADVGEVHLLIVIPREDAAWGVLEALKDTPWGKQIPVVTGENLSHALHGWALPLMREIGVPPYVHAKRVPLLCGLQKSCVGFRAAECLPGKKTPGCYQSPDGLGEVVTTVVMAWKEGRYVIVIDGPEFSLL